MSENKLPAMPGKNAAATMRDMEIAETLGEMRKDIVRNEERTVGFVCACSGASFRVRFERASDVDRFGVAAIEKGEQPRAAAAGVLGRRQSAEASSEAFVMSEFDLRGWSCPWCNAGASFERCSFRFARCGRCRALVCSGRARKLSDGSQYFRCHDACGEAAAIGDTLKHLDGSAEVRTRTVPQLQSTPKISGGIAARLPGPKK